MTKMTSREALVASVMVAEYEAGPDSVMYLFDWQGYEVYDEYYSGDIIII